jgi:hypothetical protein
VKKGVRWWWRWLLTPSYPFDTLWLCTACDRVQIGEHRHACTKTETCKVIRLSGYFRAERERLAVITRKLEVADMRAPVAPKRDNILTRVADVRRRGGV